MRILLVEDDALLADGLTRALRHSGYVVDWTKDGRQADQWLADNEYDLSILDLGLPGLDGTEVLQRLRSRHQPTPVLILSAREALEERVKVLDMGADDYLVKPVALSELEARVRALIRRGRTQPEPELVLGQLRLDTVGKRAWLGQEALDLTAREWAALEFLASRANRIVSKEQIMQSLYSWDEDITPNAIEKFISRLRAKLEPGGISIRTVRGLGYYLEKPQDDPAA
ncbi:response regulator [Azospira inquinata]|uniref:Response regulator transcription factor n=1 Tax=Azospira inquinata TaxID=2785627 RepID=A0A975SNI9_9RHOO|nr:response regulator transcription factor [Azospira inquinata]QWT45041.1 response regulator transcription factor [Azospira inquinata]QWT49626.1 response regulator transcription factor [Azospira inquinata]